MADWTDEENDATVAAYFVMLSEDLAGRPCNKAASNRALQLQIKRGRGAIEFKHQNVSAVLQGAGETWIEGYKPALNYQHSLEDAVQRWFANNQAWLSRPPARTATPAFSEQPALWIGPPPSQRNAPPPAELERMTAIAKRFDVAERDERNRALGKAGEARVLAHERSTLVQAGRDDLSARVRWVSEWDGDGAGFDIASFQPDGSERLIEVKTTNGWERTPFHISRNELAVAEDRREDWTLVRLWNFSREPRAFEIRPPLDQHVALTPMSFQASLL